MGIMHGIFSGSDTGFDWAQSYYWISAGSLLFLFSVRIVGSLIDKLSPQRNQPPPCVQLRDSCFCFEKHFLL